MSRAVAPVLTAPACKADTDNWAADTNLAGETGRSGWWCAPHLCRITQRLRVAVSAASTVGQTKLAGYKVLLLYYPAFIRRTDKPFCTGRMFLCTAMPSRDLGSTLICLCHKTGGYRCESTAPISALPSAAVEIAGDTTSRCRPASYTQHTFVFTLLRKCISEEI